MSEAKYRLVEKYIINLIQNKNLTKGDLLPSENMLAEKLNIHQNTVKKGYNNLENKGYIYREQGRGTFVDSKNLTNNSITENQIIGIVVEDLLAESPLCTGIIKGVDDCLIEHGYNFILGNSNNSYKKMNDYIDQFHDKNVSGIILMPLQINNQHQKNYRIINKIVENEDKIVLVDRYLKGTSIDYVTTDNEHGGYSVTKHLLGLGHEKIAVILEPFCSTIEERLMGYKIALAENGISFDKDLIYWSEKRLDKAGQNGVKYFLESDIEFSAIICSNDCVARGAYQELKSNNLSVPDDISLVGYDDSVIARSLPVNLTSYRQEPYEMGKKAAEILINKIKNQEKKNIVTKVNLEGELIVRQSTGRVNKNIQSKI